MPPTSTPLRLPTLRAADLLRLPRPPFVDLRSPGEFAQDHLPGAINVPLFDDLERAVVGTLYARESPEAAFEEGRRQTRAKVRDLLERIAAVAGWQVPPVDIEARVDALTQAGIDGLRDGLELVPTEAPPPGALVLGCWRGGLRSQGVVALLRALGFEAIALEGGYRAYRAEVRRELERWRAPDCFVLRGLTGVGKTLVLRAIEARRPGWTLDLEGLAGHRSSILGMVGLEPCTQRTFESRLRERLAAGFLGPCVIEGESRKVGDVILPATVWDALRGGTSLELTASVARRVDVLLADYLERPENRAALARQLPFLEERLGRRKWGGVLVGWLATQDPDDDRRLVEALLEHYYDPLYRRSEKDYTYAHGFDTADPERAAEQIVAWIEARAQAPSRKAFTVAKKRSGASSHGM